MAEMEADVAGASRATYLAFGGLGFALASWASCIPQVKEQLGLSPAGLGLVLLSVAAGSMVTLPLSGAVVARVGSRLTVTAAAVLAGAGLLMVAIGSGTAVGLVVAGLVGLGLATGNWDVAMNVHGAAVERRIGYSVMTRFHASFSLGTVGGALTGAALIALGISVTAHLVAVGVIVATVVPAGARRFVADAADPGGPQRPMARRCDARRLWAWYERRTLLIGAFVLGFALAEGTGNDWISVSVLAAHHARPAVATLAYALFLCAMTSGRWLGPGLLDRYGRVRAVRSGALVAAAGLLLFVVGKSLVTAFAGVVLWGAGASLGFPVGMSAAADDPLSAPARVSVVSSVGYLGFLGGPALIGLIAQTVGVTHALAAVIAALIPAVAIASAVRPITVATMGGKEPTA